MMQTARTCTVTIAGQQYTMLSDESEQSVFLAAQRVDALLRESVVQSGGTQQRMLLLTALKLALRVVQLEQQYAELDAQQVKLMTLLTHVDM